MERTAHCKRELICTTIYKSLPQGGAPSEYRGYQQRQTVNIDTMVLLDFSPLIV